MTMDGTVRDILGYPLFSLINDARSPAVRAPANAAAGAGIPVRSTSSSRSEFAMAPIRAAVAAMEAGLLNMIEKPCRGVNGMNLLYLIESTVDFFAGQMSFLVRKIVDKLLHAIEL